MKTEQRQEISFSEWLRERRSALDVTQWELAERVGCSRETIQKIEIGARRPSRQVAELLAACLGASLACGIGLASPSLAASWLPERASPSQARKSAWTWAPASP